MLQTGSPAEISEAGRRKGCLSCISFDLRAQDEDGNAWDLSKPEVQKKAEELIDLLQPELIIGCPPCGPFSALQWLNHPKMTEQQAQDRMKDAAARVEFCVKLCRKQISRKKFFLHEHLSRASSWRFDCMEEIMQEDGVQKVESDTCAYGTSSEDQDGGLVKKPTGCLTNRKEIAKELPKRCSNSLAENKV